MMDENQVRGNYKSPQVSISGRDYHPEQQRTTAVGKKGRKTVSKVRQLQIPLTCSKVQTVQHSSLAGTSLCSRDERKKVQNEIENKSGNFREKSSV